MHFSETDVSFVHVSVLATIFLHVLYEGWYVEKPVPKNCNMMRIVMPREAHTNLGRERQRRRLILLNKACKKKPS